MLKAYLKYWKQYVNFGGKVPVQITGGYFFLTR